MTAHTMGPQVEAKAQMKRQAKTIMMMPEVCAVDVPSAAGRNSQ